MSAGYFELRKYTEQLQTITVTIKDTLANQKKKRIDYFQYYLMKLILCKDYHGVSR